MSESVIGPIFTCLQSFEMKKNAIKRKNKNTETNVPNKKSNAYIKVCRQEEKLSKLIFGDTKALITPVADPIATENAETEQNDAVWRDEDDEETTVGSALKAQQRDIPDGGINTKTNKYTQLLKQKFNKILGTPKWAQVKEADDNSDDEILQSCGFISSTKEANLPKGTLEFKKLKDLNAETYTEGPFVNSIEFHPTATVGLVAGPSAIFSLFAVDGKANNKLHSAKLDQFPIKSAKFNGSEIIFGSSKFAYMYTYDVEKMQPQKIYLPKDVTNMQRFEISPCGRYIAIIGRFGEVFVLDSKTKEKVATFKQDSKVRALAFTPDGDTLYGHSETGKVSVWSLGSQRVVHEWYDDGCVQGSNIDISPCGRYVATSSFEGVVNLYDKEALTVLNPKPRKAVLNLTTCISNLKFNPSSEVLAFSSVEKDNALKLLHVGSETVFKNFPGFNKDLSRVNSIAFSPLSGYMAIGNNKSKALLYRLKHYSNY